MLSGLPSILMPLFIDDMSKDKHRIRNPCEGCRYYLSLSSATIDGKVCHYMLMTWQPRGCEPEKCDKRKEKKE